MRSSEVPDGPCPPVDERLVAPESRFEIVDGRVKYVPPADREHGVRHSKISALVEAHVGDAFEVASDMLTRTSRVDDIAPDVSVFPFAPDPVTGGRQLEQLAFEIMSTQTLKDAGAKAQKLIGRGVRRVFGIDVSRSRVFEWSPDLGTWSMLSLDGRVEDACLAAPLPVDSLVTAAKSDDAVARALLAKGNPIIEQALRHQRGAGRAEGREAGKAEGREAGKAEGQLEALLLVLAARGLEPSAQQLEKLRGGSSDTLRRQLELAVQCTTVEQLLD